MQLAYPTRILVRPANEIKQCFTRECNVARKCKINAHKNSIRNSTPLRNDVDIKHETDISKRESKKKFNEHKLDNTLSRS